MKQMLIKCTVLILMLSFFCVPMASANRLAQLSRRLNLSAAQQATIKAIAYKSSREKITLRASLQLARLDLHQIVSEHKPDEQKVIAAIDKLAQFEVAMKKANILMMVRIKAVLTPSQAAKMAQINARKRARRKRMRGKFRRWRQKHGQRGGNGGAGLGSEGGAK